MTHTYIRISSLTQCCGSIFLKVDLDPDPASALARVLQSLKCSVWLFNVYFNFKIWEKGPKCSLSSIISNKWPIYNLTLEPWKWWFYKNIPIFVTNVQFFAINWCLLLKANKKFVIFSQKINNNKGEGEGCEFYLVYKISWIHFVYMKKYRFLQFFLVLYTKCRKCSLWRSKNVHV